MSNFNSGLNLAPANMAWATTTCTCGIVGCRDTITCATRSRRTRMFMVYVRFSVVIYAVRICRRRWCARRQPQTTNYTDNRNQFMHVFNLVFRTDIKI